jgi:hypothetical protein
MYDAERTNYRRLVGALAEVPGSLTQTRYVLQASGIALRRTEEESAEAFFPLRGRRRRRIQGAMREQDTKRQPYDPAHDRQPHDQ